MSNFLAKNTVVVINDKIIEYVVSVSIKYTDLIINCYLDSEAKIEELKQKYEKGKIYSISIDTTEGFKVENRYAFDDYQIELTLHDVAQIKFYFREIRI